MALMQFVQPQQKESAIDRLAKVLGIVNAGASTAANIYGIKKGMDDNSRAETQFQTQQKELSDQSDPNSESSIMARDIVGKATGSPIAQTVSFRQLHQQGLVPYAFKKMEAADQHRGKLEEITTKSTEDRKTELAKADRERGTKQGALATELRKERSGLGISKSTQELATAYGKMTKSDATPAGDMSLIFGYMKMLDPGSTVREGEYATAQNAAGIPVQIANLYNKAKDGVKLAPEQRADFLKQAGGIYQAQLERQRSVDDSFRKLAAGAGVPEDQVLLDFGQNDKPSGGASFPKTVRRKNPQTGTVEEAVVSDVKELAEAQSAGFN
jgi:hypothetical protein